jgi:aconitase A
VIKINLDTLKPHVNGPFTPDLAHAVGAELTAAVKTNKWPEPVSAGLIGSCTNSSYEDMARCADLTQQAALAGIKFQSEMLVTPGSEQVRHSCLYHYFMSLVLTYMISVTLLVLTYSSSARLDH